MLKLQRIELIGFKSFSDRGEIVVHDSGVTAIVGPNGCGKSNVSDAIAWVLGEQSAKSLRGEKMEDVIFNGTRQRAPMGMAEVTMTLAEVDTEPVELSGDLLAVSGGHANGNGHGPPAGARQIVVQRRLYRSGESVYLMNGKPCRLRDVHDVFLGTGLGPNSYAIIEQGRVGQLLSAKPMDRRTLIEEAAGITKFKAKRKLAESRLEAARLNLSRVNDILAEVDRQRNSLRRQAGKARRFIELRNRMRDILSAVFATRADFLVNQQETVESAIASIGEEGRKLELQIESLTALVRQRRSDVESEELKLEDSRVRHSEVELEHEKASQRVERFEDQIQSLDERKVALAAERTRAQEDLTRHRADQAVRVQRLAELEGERLAAIASIEQITGAIRERAERRDVEVRAMEELRRKQFEIVGSEARTRNEIVSRREMILRLGAQIQRLEREAHEAEELALGIRAQLALTRDEHAGYQETMSGFKVRLAETEQRLSGLKGEYADAVKASAEARSAEDGLRNRLQTIGELEVRRAYSTQSVQQFFSHVRQLDWSPLGILADFVEVDPNCEAIVENFLRFELQYVVVQDVSQAERALAVVKDVTRGWLDCLVLNGTTSPAIVESIDGAVPLASVLRFDPRVTHFAGIVRDAYIVDTLDQAWAFSRRYPEYRFIARTGEVVRGHVVGWGQHEAHGPLSLKREIRELDSAMQRAAAETLTRQSDVLRLEELVRDTDAAKARLVVDLQEIEKTILTVDHRARSLTSDLGRADDRSTVAMAENARFAEEQRELERAVSDAERRLAEIAESRLAIDEDLRLRAVSGEELRAEIEARRADLTAFQSTLAVLEERRSTAARELNALGRQVGEAEDRIARAGVQIGQAESQQAQTRDAIVDLEETLVELRGERDALNESIAQTTIRLEEARREMRSAENRWDEARLLLDTWKDRHGALEIEKTQVEADLKHLTGSCFNELDETIESVCLKYFAVLSADALADGEREHRDIRERMNAMGAVNMMAVDEYQEAEERFLFLSTQRQDLLDSIRDTAQAIEEIDSVCRRQFREAYDTINSGFTTAFIHLFGGGHGELRLLEEEGQADAGVEIVAQPPGKKLQNVLLLSGGEKALTALALLIALFRFKPSPFCVLDEVDAPLDDANVDRFANMVREMSRQTQFIVITHSKRTMETASTLYGVTMEEPGISKIVSVRLS